MFVKHTEDYQSMLQHIVWIINLAKLFFAGRKIDFITAGGRVSNYHPPRPLKFNKRKEKERKIDVLHTEYPGVNWKFQSKLMFNIIWELLKYFAPLQQYWKSRSPFCLRIPTLAKFFICLPLFLDYSFCPGVAEVIKLQ